MKTISIIVYNINSFVFFLSKLLTNLLLGVGCLLSLLPLHGALPVLVLVLLSYQVIDVCKYEEIYMSIIGYKRLLMVYCLRECKKETEGDQD